MKICLKRISWLILGYHAQAVVRDLTEVMHSIAGTVDLIFSYKVNVAVVFCSQSSLLHKT
jgi:hypothetical protein